MIQNVIFKILSKFIHIHLNEQITVASLSKALSVFAFWITVFVGSNPTRDIAGLAAISCVCMPTV
jgi:hypothetical protein